MPIEAEQVDQTCTYGGFWRRAGAGALDLLIFAALLMGAGAVGGDGQITPAIVCCVLILVVLGGYYPGFEASPWQATPGKRIFGLIVTDINGQRISYTRACIRNGVKYFSGGLTWGFDLYPFW